VIVKDIQIIKTSLYLTIISGVIGAAFLAVDIGAFSLFPYRILLLSLWLFVLICIVYRGRLNISHIRVKPYIYFLMFWIFYAILSIAWAASSIDAIRDIIFLFMGLSIIFLVVFYFRNLKDLKRFFDLWLLILLPLIALGFWNYLTGNHLSISTLIYAEERLRFAPTAVFHNQNDFATYLALSIPFILAFIRYNRNIAQLLLGIIMLVTSLFLIVVTFSRVNYLAVFMGTTFWLIFLLKVREKIKAVVLIGLVAALLFVGFPGKIQNLFRTVDTQVSMLHSETTQSGGGSLSVRYNLVRNSFIFLGNSLGFGVGAGNVEYHMANSPVYETSGRINVHNWWVEILTNYGIFIFTGYVVFYLGLLISLYKIYRRLTDTSERMICEASLVSLVIFFFSSMSSSSIMALRPQWILFAFALGFLNYYRAKH